MMLRANNEILEFDDEIEVEKQIKLFEEISTTDGDFSYAFDLQKTLNNSRILGNPFPDNILKPVYQKIPAELLTDNGSETFKGYIRIEKITNVYQCSFFAGNNNWFGLLSGPLRSLDWSAYDIIQNQGNIEAAKSKTKGVVFPLIDNGVLMFRGAASLKVEDFVAGIYVKDVFNKVFSSHGIKLKGELLSDANFLSSITINNNKNAQSIADRSSFVKTTNAPTGHSASYVKMNWTDDTNHPYFDGAADNFSLTLDRYTADVPMIVKFEWIINNTIVPTVFGEYKMAFYKNGVLDYAVIFNDTPAQPLTITKIYNLSAGDYIEAFVWDDAGIFADPITDSTIRVTPTYVYKVFGENVVPDWSQQEYISNVIRLFNVLASYDSKNKTLTFNLFEKIGNKTAIDLSPYISSTEIDYSEFINDYGKKSLLSFQEMSPDETFINLNLKYRPYSKGEIAIDNDFLDDSVDILESDFTNPITYLHPVFDMSIEKTDLVSLEQQESVDVSGVTNSAGLARFAVSEDVFAVTDIVRVSDSTNVTYNGDYKVFAVGSGYIELIGLNFATSAIAKIGRMQFVYTDSDAVFFLHNVPDYEIPKFSSRPLFVFEDTDEDIWAIAFFSLINTGRQIDLDFINSVSFSGEQRTLIDQYFNLMRGVFNDPVKLFSEAYLPYSVFMGIDFLSPIKIQTEETQNNYYLNRITGYKESYLPCTLELIKLSSPVVTVPEEDVVPPNPPVLSPEFVQNANAVFVTGSAATLTFTFSSNLATDTDVWIYTSADTKLGFPAGGATVNQGIIATFVSINGASNNWGIMWNMRGFPGSNNILTISFTVGNRYSNITGIAYETRHGLWIGNAFDSISASARTSAVLSGGTNIGVSSALIVGAGFVGVPGFTTTSDPPGVALEVTGNNALQSVYGGFIVPAGVSQNTMQIDWVNSLQAWGYCIELVYT